MAACAATALIAPSGLLVSISPVPLPNSQSPYHIIHRMVFPLAAGCPEVETSVVLADFCTRRRYVQSVLPTSTPYSPISHTPGPIPRGMGCHRVDCTHDGMSSRFLRATFRRWYTSQARLPDRPTNISALLPDTCACALYSVFISCSASSTATFTPWNDLVQSSLLLCCSR
jgi:hypothetical protein